MERKTDIPSGPLVKPVIESELWEVVRDWTATVDGDVHTVPAGFRTDGASIPRFLWRICGHPMATRRFPAAVIHDWLYETLPDLSVSREYADGQYRAALVALGFPAWAARLEWLALRLFGGAAWKEAHGL